MKLGFYTYSYLDRLGVEIEPVLETVAAVGYEGIDISATWRDDLDPALMPAEVREIGFGEFIAHKCFIDMPLPRACEVGCPTLANVLVADRTGER